MTKSPNNDAWPEYTWYATFGSCLDEQRFQVYIRGGIAKNGNVAQPGCSDHTLPSEDCAIEIPYSLYFAGLSAIWHGAVAFLDPIKSTHFCKSRAYLIKTSQFWEVAGQENHWHGTPQAPHFAEFQKQGFYDLQNPSDFVVPASGQYKRVLYCGQRDGYPVVTLTTPHRHTDTGKPSPAYLHTMIRGLKQSSQLTDSDIAAYLMEAEGIKGSYDAAELQTVIADAQTVSVESA